MNTKEALFHILREAVIGNSDGFFDLSGCDLDKLNKLAEIHGLDHILGYYFGQNKVSADEDLLKAFEKQMKTAIFRDAKHDYVRSVIFDVFKESGIMFVPLKGAVVRELYPETWMRTSCDIDILVKEDELSKAVKVLTDNGFETDGKRNYHDVSVYFDEVQTELHFNICENLDRVDKLLKDVWSYTEQTDGSEYREVPEYFAFHHIAHMCYHFINGGCGIKPFIDLYLLKNSGYYDEEKLYKLLDKCELRVFYNKFCELMNVWFCGAEHNELTLKLEKYIINGGEFGTVEGGSTVSSAYNNGKAANFFKIVFPDYYAMCNYYPTVKKYKITLPFFYIKRIFSKLTGKTSDVVFKMKTIANQNGNEVEEAGEMLKSLGL